ncbi:hypothetical protein TKK_0017798 [Trichogramma kaykai]
MAENDQMCFNKLKLLRATLDWDIGNERREFFEQFYSLIEKWEGPLPNLRDIFDENEIEYLLSECANSSDNVLEPDPLIEFLIKTGYKDEPAKLDEAGKPMLRRTTPGIFPGTDALPVARSLLRADHRVAAGQRFIDHYPGSYRSKLETSSVM